MKRFLQSFVILLCTLISASSLFAQSRDFHAYEYWLDNTATGSLIGTPSYHTYLLQAPAGLNSNETYTFPNVPSGNPTPGFVFPGTLAGQFLVWVTNDPNAPSGAWEPTSASVLTGNGTTNDIPKWTTASAVGNSVLADNGVTFSVNSAALPGGTTEFSVTEANGNTSIAGTLGVAGATTLSNLSTGVVHSGATGLLSSSAVGLSTADVTGTLPVGNGGTNGTAAPTAGAVSYGTGTAYAFSLAGTSGQVLTSGGAGAPTWTNQSSLTIPFTNITSGTNAAAAMVVGTGASLTVSGTGTINATTLLGSTWAAPAAIGSGTANTGAFTTLSTTGNITDGGISTGVVHSNGTGLLSSSAVGLSTADVTGTLPVGNGGTNGTAAPTAGAVSYGTGTAYAFSLAGTSGQVLTSGGAGAPTWTNQSSLTIPFTNITSGTNAAAAMVVGTGASLTVSGTGTINATTLLGSTWAAPAAIGSGTANTGAFTTLSTTGNITDGGNIAVTGGTATLGNATTAGSLVLNDAHGNTTTITTQNQGAASVALTLPAAQGAANTVLTNNGAGLLSWASPGATLLAANNTWTGTNNFQNAVTIDPLANNVTSLLVEQTTAAVPGSDIIDVTASNGTTKYLSVNSTGGVMVPTLSTGVVHSNGTGLLSSSAVGLSTADVTGTLPVGNGGTNGTAAPTAGAVSYGTGTAYAFSLAGTSGQVLTSGGAGAPTWTNQSSLTIPFTNITSGTNAAAAMVVGTGASLTVSGTGTINATTLLGSTWAAPAAIGSGTANTGAFTTLSTTGNITDGGISTGVVHSNGTGLLSSSAVGLSTADVTGTLPVGNGGTNGTAAPTAGAVSYGTGTAYAFSLAGTSGQVLTSGGAGAPTWTNQSSLTIPFTNITSGTNAAAAMVVGTGASLTVSGTGTINATTLLGSTWAAPAAIGSGTANTGAFTTLSTTGNITDGGISTGVVHSNGTGLLSSSAVGLSTADVTGTLPVGNGGTNGTAAPTAGAVSYGTGTAYAFSLAGTSGQVLTSGGAGAPTWTNQSSLTIPFTNITSGTNAAAAMVVGTGASLTVSGTGTINATTLLGSTWAAPAAIGSGTANTGAFTTLSTTGNITDGGISTGVVHSNGTGLLSSSAVGLSTADVTGTLPVGNGGTNGTAAPTAGAVSYGTGTAYAFSLAGTSGQVLTSGGAGAPTWTNQSSLTIPFTNITSGTNAAAAMVVGTGASLTVSGTGTINATTLLGSAWAAPAAIGSGTANTGAFTTLSTTGNITDGGISTGVVHSNGTGLLSSSAVGLSTADVTGTLPVGNGGTNGTAAPTAGAVSYGTGTAYAFSLAGTSGQVLTSGGAGAPTWTNQSSLTIPFTNITSGTNAAAAMVVGTGASLTVSGTGTINATTLLGSTWAAPAAIGSGTANTGAFTTLSTTGNITDGGNIAVTGGTATLGNATTAGSLVLQDGHGSTTTFSTTNQSGTSITYTLPAAQGASGTVLTNGGGGSLSWAAPASAVTSVTGTVNEITASPTTGNVILSIPTTFNAPGSITATTTLTATTGLTVSAGGASISGATAITSGGLQVTGGETIQTGGVTITAGGLTLTSGPISLAGSNGTTGQVLTSAGSGTPTWSNSVLSVGATSPLSNTGTAANPVIALTGTVGTANGGTGAGSFTSNGVLYGNGASTIQVTAAPTANQVLLSTGGAPTFTALSTDATLVGNGVGTAFGINLTHADTWTNAESFSPSTSGEVAVTLQGAPTSGDIIDVEANGGSATYFSVNHSGNVTINPATGGTVNIVSAAANTSAVNISTGSTSGKVTIGGLGTASQSASKIDLETSGAVAINNAKPASGTAGGVNIGNADATHGSGAINIESGTGTVSINESTTTATVVGNGSGNVYFGSVGTGSFSAGFVDLQGGQLNSSGSGLTTLIDGSGNVNFLTITTNQHLQSTAATDNTPVADANATTGSITSSHATDVAGIVVFNTGATPAVGNQIDIPVTTSYNKNPIVIVSANDAATAALQPFAYYSAGNIVIGVATAGAASTAYTFNYQIIEVQQ